jgi:hypothetical protein
MQEAAMAYMADIEAMESALAGTGLEGKIAPNGISVAQVLLARLASEDNGRRLLITMDGWNELEEQRNAARAEAERLHQLLDDIDTLRDAIKVMPGFMTEKEVAEAHRKIAERALDISDKRWDGPITTDGYQFWWKGDPKPEGWQDPPEPSSPESDPNG